MLDEYNDNEEDDYEENYRAPPTRSALETRRNRQGREGSVQSEDSANDQAAPTTRSMTESRRSRYLPYKDVLTEYELQVKIADLGNGCWTVCYCYAHIIF